MEHEEEYPFYGTNIIRREEKEIIHHILQKYKGQKVSDELKKQIWDELQMAKYRGIITIPFKIAVRKDPLGKYPDYIEVILDSKV